MNADRGSGIQRLLGALHRGLATLLVTAAVVLVNYLAFRHYTRWDWTEQRIYTLSERTKHILKTLRHPVDIYVFLSESEPNFREVRELTERYRAQTNHVHVHLVDPDRKSSEFRILAQRFGLSAGQTESGETLADVAAVVAVGSRRWTITRDDFLGYDLGGGDAEQPKLDVKAEQSLTSAIVQATSGKPAKVCLTTGHGEWSLEPGGERSLHPLEKELRRDNVEMKSLSGPEMRNLPRECIAVFIIGPIAAFSEFEARALNAYAQGGGNVLAALDPVLREEAVLPTGLEEFAKGLGVTIDDSIVVERDPANMLTPNVLEPFVITAYGPHVTTNSIAKVGGRTALNMARSIRPRDGFAGATLLKTSDAAIAKRSLRTLAAAVTKPGDDALEPGDVKGPVSVAVAVQVPSSHAQGFRKDGGRVIIVGDSDWLLGPFFQSAVFANFDLANAWTGFLTARPALLSIAPKRVGARAIAMTESDLTALALRVILMLPAAAFLLGLSVWWARRS